MDHARVGSLHMPSWLEIYHVVQQQGFIYPNSTSRWHIRPYYLDNTVSRPICEVKQGQVRLVLAWGTSWEVRMLYIFCSFLHFFCSFFLFCVFLGKAGNHMIMVIQFDGGEAMNERMSIYALLLLFSGTFVIFFCVTNKKKLLKKNKKNYIIFW